MVFSNIAYTAQATAEVNNVQILEVTGGL